MSFRRGGKTGPGPASSGDERDGPSGVGAPPSEAAPRSSALVTRRQNRLVVHVPTGMAAMEQLGAFRELRTRLLSLAAAAGLSHFTTLVVPIRSGAGGSFVARNLAAAFTLEQRPLAILIDCNMAHPTQHVALGLTGADGGLFEYLEHPHGDVERLIRTTSVPALHLIPAGRPPSTSREYFSSDTMRKMMTALRQPSCYVFLDSPPAKGAPDAKILSDLADFVVLVVGYGQDAPEDIARAAALFDPAKFVGVVFNERM